MTSKLWTKDKVENNVKVIPTSKIKIKKKDYLENGKYPIIDQGKKLIGGFTNDKKKLVNDIPVVVFGDHTRIVKFIDFPFAQGADGTKILKPSEEFEPKLFYYFLKNLKINNKGYARHYSLLKNALIPKPSMDTQKQIIPILDNANKLLTLNLQKNKKIVSLRNSIFLKMFGDPISNSFKWEVVQLSQVLDDAQYGSGHALNLKNGVQCFRMNNITDEGTLDISEMKYLSYETEKYLLKKDDILFNRTNSKELVGKTAIFDLDGDYTFAGYLVKLKTDLKKCNPKFLSCLMNFPSIKKIIRGMAIDSVNQSNISASRIQNLKIYLPPIDLQNSFADLFELITKIQKKQLVLISKYYLLSQNLEKLALQGKLIQ